MRFACVAGDAVMAEAAVEAVAVFAVAVIVVALMALDENGAVNDWGLRCLQLVVVEIGLVGFS